MDRDKWYKYDPGACIKDVFLSLPRKLKLAMASTFIIGLIAHGFCFTNLLLTDDTCVLYSRTGGTGLWDFILKSNPGARWLQGVFEYLSNGLTMPWLLGIAFLFFYGLTAFFACELLKLEDSVSVVLLSGLLVTAPMAISSALCSAASHFFSLSVCMSCLAACSYKNLKRGRLLCFLFFFISAGTYAPSIAFGISLYIISVICDLLRDKEKDFKNVFLNEVIFAAIGALACAVNFLITMIIGKLTENLVQERVSEVYSPEGSGSIIKKVFDAYKHTVSFYVWPYSNRNGYFWESRTERYLLWATGIFTLVLIFIIIRKKKIRPVNLALIGANVIILPLAMNIIGVFSYAHTLMISAFIIPWIFFIKFRDDIYKDKEGEWPAGCRTGALYTLTVYLLSFITIASGCFISNAAYIKKYNIYESELHLVNRIADITESVPGYVQGVTPVYYIGSLDKNYSVDHSRFPYLEGLYGIGGEYSDTAIKDGRVFSAYLEQELALNINLVTNPVLHVESAEAYAKRLGNVKDVTIDEEKFIADFNRTESFPSHDCYFWEGDILVIKLETE